MMLDVKLSKSHIGAMAKPSVISVRQQVRGYSSYFLTFTDTGSSITYSIDTGKKWTNENGKTSHMKVVMVHDPDKCEKECTATVPCVAFTFIPEMEICALKAPRDAVTLVSAGSEIVSGKLDGERPSVQGKELNSTFCLPCLPGSVP